MGYNRLMVADESNEHATLSFKYPALHRVQANDKRGTCLVVKGNRVCLGNSNRPTTISSSHSN